MATIRRAGMVGTWRTTRWHRTLSGSSQGLWSRLNPFRREEETVTGSLCDPKGKYEFLEELGVGRYGVVRAVRKINSSETFACKTIPKADVLDLEELRNEVDILKRVSHPHVLGVVEALEDKESVYLISERMKGGELFDRIISKGHFSEKDAAVVMRQLLLALEYLHGNRIMHRDVKPENLLFIDDTAESALALIDFGMARIFQQGHFLTTSCGSASYVAPEVLHGQYDEKCDVWSAGVILFIQLCGKVPFGGFTDEEIMRNVAMQKYSFDDPAWNVVSDEAKELVRAMMCVDPTKRLTATQCLEHPWIADLGGGRDSPLISAMLNIRNLQSHVKLKKLSLDIIATHFSNLSHDQVARDEYILKLRDTFTRLDVEHKGVIPADVLARAILEESQSFNSFNVLTTAENLSKMLEEEVDKDHNKFIDLKEFIAAALDPIHLQERHLRVAFDALDKDRDGSISLEELHMAYGDEDVAVNKETLRREFDELDLNKDGRISFQEYEEFMKKKE